MKSWMEWTMVATVLAGLVFQEGSARAETETVDGVEWSFEVEDGEATVTGSEPAEGALSIPSQLGGCPVVAIDDYAFEYCGELTSVTIPDGVRHIGWYAFAYSGLESVSIPASVESIYNLAFCCDYLEEIKVSADNSSFSDVDGVLFSKSGDVLLCYPGGKAGAYTIPDGVEEIAAESFNSCRNLTSLEIGDSVTRIGVQAFESCSGLTSLTIPDGVTRIDDLAFENCYNLESVALPAGLSEVGSVIFRACDGLEEISLPPANPYFTLADGVLFSKSRETLVGCLVEKEGAYTIPGGVTAIGEDAFRDCYGLTAVTIPDGVASIGYQAFANCGNLKSINIPDTVEEIGGWAFESCNGLASLTLPESVTAIGYGAFAYCGGLKNLYVPASWEGTDILEDAYVPAGCRVRYGVEELVVMTSELPVATEGAAYEAALAAKGGTVPYSWSATGGGYGEVAQPNGYSETGTAQGWQADDDCWELELPFAFPYFGNPYTTARINSNGTISFGDDYFSDCYYSENRFLGTPVIAVLWDDLETSDVYVDTGGDWVKIQWRGTYLNEGAVNCSATLSADGRIVLSYGGGNGRGGYVGVSAGDGETALYSAMSNAGNLENADDIVFKPLGLPEGVGMSADGVLRGTPQEAGIFAFTAVVTDSEGETAGRKFTLEVLDDPALLPALAATSPKQGYVNLGTATSKKMWVKATHPAGGALSYAWSVDDGAVAGTKTNYTYRRADTELHTVRCTVSGEDLPRTASAEWRVGVLTVDGPADAEVSYGQKVVLQADVASSLAADVAWYDGSGVRVGSGNPLVLEKAVATETYRAVASSAMGSVTGRTATVTVDTRPSVGRIHKLTGAPFAGNRLVLRAKAYGDLTGATYSWKCDGREVATTERLDIASLGAGDFGTYTLTVTTSHGTATSGGFVLAPAPAGVPAGWGSDYGEGYTDTPAGLAGVVQMAAGSDFNLALRSDGSVTAWGGNSHGGCDVPAGLSGVSQVAAFRGWSGGAGFAVKTDSSLVGWGKTYSVNTYWSEWAHGEYDEETGEWTYTPDWVTYTNGTDLVGTIPSGLTDVVKVAVGSQFGLALTAGGRVMAWGSGYYPPVPEDLSDAVDIAVGQNAGFALLADGTVTAWGYGWNGETDVPEDLSGVVAVDAPQSGAAFALQADGSLRAWGDNYGYDGLRNVPQSAAGFVRMAAGASFGTALDAAGRVAVWGQTWSVGNIPDWIQGGALGIAAGSSHCMALVADTDGDTVPDGLEPRYGRDPSVWEPWERVSVGGTVTVDGSEPPGRILFVLLDAEGHSAGHAEADESGAWSIGGVVPGRYTLQVTAGGAVDPEPVAVSTLGGAVAGLDFDLLPGEGMATASLEAHLAGDGERFKEEDCSVVELPRGTQVYLDMWPAEPDSDGLLDLGEVGGCISALDGTGLLPHAVGAKRPESGAQVPVPAAVGGKEGETVTASPHFSSAPGSVRIVTEPAGAEVWVDYADQSLGVTPLTLSNLSAAACASHVLLLKKDGYLQPRSVEFRLEAGQTGEIRVPLAQASAPAMTVEVSSAIPGMDIYLDYRPTGQVTPATVGGMDPASHAGSFWYSASHSILLRHAALRPFAPRAVPDERTWNETSGEWQPVLEAELHIVAPNTYDDSDGDGVPNGHETEAGTDPFDPASRPDGQVAVFMGNGGFPDVQKTTNAIGAAYGTLPVPEWEGHLFLGWFTKADGGAEVTAVSKVTTAAARTLYAHWTDRQTATFLGNGGEPASQSAAYVFGAEYGTLPAVAWAAHVFLGWFDAQDGGKRVYTNSVVALEAERTLYAHWTDRQVTTFKGNGGLPETQKTTNTIGSAYGTFPEVAWENHAFLGWFSRASGGTRVYESSKVTAAASRTLHAHWTDRQTVTFDGNGGAPAVRTATNAIGSAYGTLPVPAWAGHVFLGWFTEAEGGTGVTATDTVTLAEARTLYAHWTDRQTTTFAGNGGTPAATVRTNAMGAAYGAFPGVSWAGHVFQGWFTAAEGGVEVGAGTTVTEEVERTLYAHWKRAQALEWAAIGDVSEVEEVELSATAGSGGEIVFAVLSGPGEIEGNLLVFTDGGTVVVEASQAGDAVWAPVSAVQTVQVAAVSTDVAVRNVSARQRYPWNGLVDIDFELECNKPRTRISLGVSARDTATGRPLPVRTVKLEGGEFGEELSVRVKNLSDGKCRLVWDAGKDAPGTVADAVTVEVQALAGEGMYMVVDLSAGSGDGAVYPVSYLGAEPQGGWGDEFKTTKLVLRRIMPGTFTMGSPSDEVGRVDNESQHEVTLTQPFYIGVFEVTQKQWELVMGRNPSNYKGDMRPVEYVSWNMIRGTSSTYNWPSTAEVDAASFMGRLRARAVVGDGMTWDLPTEAQWEYACRAGTTTALNSGKNLTNGGSGTDPQMDEVGRYYYNRSDGHGEYSNAHTTVGSYLPNAWGLYDMHGNVYEWCRDWYADDLGTTAATDPKGASSGSDRVLRGGGWRGSAAYCRSASRNNDFPSDTYYYLDFRLSRILPE